MWWARTHMWERHVTYACAVAGVQMSHGTYKLESHALINSHEYNTTRALRAVCGEHVFTCEKDMSHMNGVNKSVHVRLSRGKSKLESHTLLKTRVYICRDSILRAPTCWLICGKSKLESHTLLKTRVHICRDSILRAPTCWLCGKYKLESHTLLKTLE